jgi:hypothetical protein
LPVNSLSNVKNIARSVAKMSFEIATFGYPEQARKWAARGLFYLLSICKGAPRGGVDLTKVINRHHLSFHAVGASILGSCASQVNCGLISDSRT